MKVRLGFVTNSSSSSFVIRNKSNKTLTAVDFIKEAYKYLDYSEGDDEKKISLERAMEIAADDNFEIKAGKMYPIGYQTWNIETAL
jgi:hypothetical protein